MRMQQFPQLGLNALWSYIVRKRSWREQNKKWE